MRPLGEWVTVYLPAWGMGYKSVGFLRYTDGVVRWCGIPLKELGGWR